MTKNPVSITKDSLAAKALALMNGKKITSLCVHNNNKFRTIESFIYITFYNLIFHR